MIKQHGDKKKYLQSLGEMVAFHFDADGPFLFLFLNEFFFFNSTSGVNVASCWLLSSSVDWE